MDIVILFVVVFGLCVGSFLNVLISRLPDPNRSLLKPLCSACPACGSAIRAWDNIPVLSYFILRGRCRSCRAKIGIMYPLVESIVAGIFLFAYLRYGPTVEGLSAVVFLSLLLAVAVTDARTYLIPDLYTFGGAACGIALALSQSGVGSAIQAALDGVIAGATLCLLGWGASRWLGKEALGFGDVLLVGMMATFLGFGTTAVAIWLASISGVLLYYVHSRWHPEKHIPFGLHLAIGGAASLVLRDTHEGFATYALSINQILPWH